MKYILTLIFLLYSFLSAGDYYVNSNDNENQKILFIIVEKSDYPGNYTEQFDSLQYSTDIHCSKIVAFNNDSSQAILQVWVDSTYFVKSTFNPGHGFYKNLTGLEKSFHKSNHKTYIGGKQADLWNNIPAKFKVK